LFKGLFWCTEDGTLIVYKTQCDTNGIPLNPDLPYNSRRRDSFTHKATWEEAARNQPRETRSKTWNHFPRGRVEIKASKVNVYHNPVLASQIFEQQIIDEFELAEQKSAIRFIPDHSRHYMDKLDG